MELRDRQTRWEVSEFGLDGWNPFAPEQKGIFVPPYIKLEGSLVAFPPFPKDRQLYNNRDKLIIWLVENGWNQQTDTHSLLKDFMKLSEYYPLKMMSDGEFLQIEDKYNKFILKYGPLWNGYRAMPPEIAMRQKDEKRSRKPRWYNLDHWYGYENLFVWQQETMGTVAIFEIARLLKEGKKIPQYKKRTKIPDDLKIAEKLITFLGGFDLPLQRQLLASIVTHHINKDLTLKLSWNGELTTALDTGIGFMGVVWLKIAQVLSGKMNICICSGCGRLYIREGRKPQQGRKNFCDECGDGDRASKRISARNHQ